ncbi:signal transduction histidine kinase [Candidatus Scalindua japonica]|uniref:histidine kinase n=2 Tax=Candidatus Scalindua japonica TaxID=1284222 RepID=A0A286U4N8_9BACT|nr:signal transduction histidine kinase [Candidatus Scalindua japonica]
MLYYSTTSFIVIGIVCFVVGEFFSRIEKNDLIERSEKYAGYIVDHINLEMYEEFFAPTMSKYGYVDLENNRDQFNSLDKVIKSNIYGFNLKKLYLFDRNGQIVYSNIPEHIGYVLEMGDNLQLDSAIRGISASALQEPGMKDSKGVIVDKLLLESYYPVYEYNKGIVNREKQTGVMEIYQNMEELDIQISSAHQKAVLITGASMGLLFLILLLIIKKASNVIQLKTDQLVEARDNLEEKVDARTHEIKQTFEKLQETQKRLGRSEKLAGIGTLAAGVAHEINNPLASVASCAEGLMDRIDNVDFKTKDDEEVFPDYLKTIYDETYRCKAIISKLLDFSRRQVPVFDKVNVNVLVANVVKLIGRQKEREKISVELNYSPEPTIIYGDINQLQQVFLNMILNAFDATADGGKIKITTTRIDNYAKIIFEDAGCGIAPENLDKIFEPFFSTKSTGKGTGLGLSICYGIIEEHKGKISVSSNGVGKGTVFTISLPV